MVSPPNSVIVVVLEYYDRWEQFVDMLLPILEEDYQITDYDRPIRRYKLSFSKPRLYVKFVSVEDMYEKLRGLPHDQQLIMDLEELPSWYFSNPILVGESWELRELQERLLGERRARNAPRLDKMMREEDSKQRKMVQLPWYIN